MKLHIKKLNMAGVGHHALIAVLVIAGFAGFGTWRILAANAATASASNAYSVGSQEGCSLAGRKWTNNKCEAKCIDSTKYQKTLIKKVGYCKGHVSRSTVGNGKNCVDKLKRKYVKDVGCARLLSQKDTVNAKQCQKEYPNYKVDTNKKTDKCVNASGGSGTSPNNGNPATSTSRDTTKPAILVPTEAMKASGQWESIDPRTGYSYAQEAAIWTKSRAIADELYKVKTQKVIYAQNGFGDIVHWNLDKALDWYKIQVSSQDYGSWRWINEDPSDNLFNAYSSSKKYTTYGGGGYNPNYFKSQAEQDSWIKKYQIIAPTNTIFGTGTIDPSSGVSSTQASFKYKDGYPEGGGISPGFTALPSWYYPNSEGISPFRANKPLL